jgi:hypothetical protein
MDDLIVPSTPLPAEPEAAQGNIQLPEYAVQPASQEIQ